MKSILAVGIGGFFGAICRYTISLSIPHTGSFPLATFSINLVGCLSLAWLFTTFVNRTPLTLGIGTGFLGAFTTFSTFSVETLVLLENNEWMTAVSYSLLSVIGGLLCAMIGARLARRRIT